MRCTADDFTRCPDYRRMAESTTGPHDLDKGGCVI